MKYIQHFHHLFNPDPTSPDQNIVITPGDDFEHLPEVMNVLLSDDARAEIIATNSFNFYRHWLSPASVNCYWRRCVDRRPWLALGFLLTLAFRLITRWAEVQNFEPVLHRSETSFNSFILLGKVKWIPY